MSKITTEDLSDDIVDALEAEAAAAGDYAMSTACNRWLVGEHTKAEEHAIIDALNDAAAQREGGAE